MYLDVRKAELGRIERRYGRAQLAPPTELGPRDPTMRTRSFDMNRFWNIPKKPMYPTWFLFLFLFPVLFTYSSFSFDADSLFICANTIF
jgi:hypothetical protein